jgi:hypothetical protein
MPKKKKKGRSFHQGASKASGVSSKQMHARRVSGPPMLVDGEPVRRAARQAHEKVRAQMEVMENQIKNFEQKEVPAFQRWMHLNFGPELAELRETESAAASKEMILDKVDYYQFEGNISPAHAYAKVKSEMADPDRKMDAYPPDENDADSDFAGLSAEDEEDLRDAYEAASNMFEKETGSRAPDFESFKTAIGMEKKQAKSSQNRMDPKQSRIKTLYRLIARSLHPDCSDQFSLREQRLWHRAQEAYKAGDVVALEAVLSHIEAAAAGPLFASSVSDLMENTREMRMRMSYLEEDLQQARQHPAWRFTQKNQNQLRSLHKRIKKEITLSLQQIRRDLAAAEEALQQLEFAHARMMTRKQARKRKKAATSARQEAFQF